MKLISLITFFISIAVLFSQCANTSTTSDNFSKLYSGSNTSLLHPKFTVYHHKADSSEFFYSINTKDLLYVRKDKVEPFSAKLMIHYELYESIYSKKVLDSATKTLVDINNDKTHHDLSGTISFKQQLGSKSVLKIYTTDFHRKSMNEQLFFINKENQSGRQFFLLKNKGNQQPLFENYITKNSDFEVYSALNKGKELFARFYYRNFPIAAPPFSSTSPKPFDYQPDLTASIQISDEGTVFIKGPDSGYVHLQTDTASKQGYTLFRFNTYFPEIKTAEDMIPPLRYISTKTEYDNLISAENKKEAVDTYWLKKCGTAARGRDVIKMFYNRVQDANSLFTSYTEGWATDRGMIYIIFGKPGVVNKTSTAESWIYGAESNMMALRFDFDKIDNPFTDNDFKLDRNISYRSNWYRAVDSWRSGRTYWLQ